MRYHPTKGKLMFKKPTKLQVFRYTVQSIVGLSTYYTTSQLIKSNTPDAETRLQKVALGTGTFALSQMIAGHAELWAVSHIDNTAKEVRKQKMEREQENPFGK
jgi:hypothetical protein